MAQQSKVQVRALVRQLIDDPGGKFWSTANLDLLIEGCLDELWGELLDQFPWLRSTTTTVSTPNAPGYLDLWDDASNTDFTRLYRVQRVVRNGFVYAPISPGDIAIEGSPTSTISNGMPNDGVALRAPDHTYAIFGKTLHLFPYSTDADITIQYSSLPEPFTSLSPGPDPDDPQDDDISFVDWPDGYHMAYIYDIASKAIEKGDREDSQRLGRRSEASMFRLKAFLRKQSTGAMMPHFHDDGLDYA